MIANRMHQVRVGVVGVGYGQRVLIPAFRANARCTVAALCASTREGAQRVADRVDVPRAYGDWRELVSDPEIQAVAIATPPAIQPDIVKAAVAARKHVFCEKPVAITREAAAQMLLAARQAGVAHMVDFEFPMIEAWQQAKALVERDALGRVQHALVSWQFESYSQRTGLRSWKTSTEEGGGTVNLFVSHTFYYLEWLLGPIQSLCARLFPLERRTDASRGDTLAMLGLLLGNGTPGSVTVNSKALLGRGHRVELYGDHGSLVLENPTADYVNGFRLWFGRRGESQFAVVPIPDQQPVDGDSRIPAVGRLIERFVNWIDHGIPSAPTLEDGYRVQCLLDAVHEADRTGTWVDIDGTVVPRKSVEAHAGHV